MTFKIKASRYCSAKLL